MRLETLSLLRRVTARLMAMVMVMAIWAFSAWCSSLDFMINLTAIMFVIVLALSFIWGYIVLMDRWWNG